MNRIALISILSSAILGVSGTVYAQTSPRQEDTGITAAEFEEIVMGLPLFSEVIRTWTRKSVGGRWSEAHSTVHQFTFGFQRVAKRWVFEGAVIQDLNDPDHTRFLFSVRFH